MPDLYGNKAVSEAEHREHDRYTFGKRVTDVGSTQEYLLDYADRTDDNPVYVGIGPAGVTSNDQAAAVWLIYKLTYEETPVVRITRKQANTGVWNDRASLF